MIRNRCGPQSDLTKHLNRSANHQDKNGGDTHRPPGNDGGIIVAVGLILFAYSTVLGWSYYAEKALEYLLGEKSFKPYRIVFASPYSLGRTPNWNLSGPPPTSSTA